MESEFSGFLVEGRLPCLAAFRVKETWRQSPRDVGDAATEADIRISLCQLGLFGYEEFGGKRIPRLPMEVPERIRAALAVEGEAMSCARAWALAEELAISRCLLGGMLDALDIRVIDCQLGCF